LAERAGLARSANQEKPLLVQLLQQLKLNPQGAGAAQQNVAAASSVAAPTSPTAATEEVKQVSSTSKSPFRSSNTVSASGPAAGENKNGSPGGEDDIEEDIVQDHEDIQLQPNSARDAIAASGGTSTSAVGVDQSIDTLRLEEFDYVEDVKNSPRSEI